MSMFLLQFAPQDQVIGIDEFRGHLQVFRIILKIVFSLN